MAASKHQRSEAHSLDDGWSMADEPAKPLLRAVPEPPPLPPAPHAPVALAPVAIDDGWDLPDEDGLPVPRSFAVGTQVSEDTSARDAAVKALDEDKPAVRISSMMPAERPQHSQRPPSRDDEWASEMRAIVPRPRVISRSEEQASSVEAAIEAMEDAFFAMGDEISKEADAANEVAQDEPQEQRPSWWRRLMRR